MKKIILLVFFSHCFYISVIAQAYLTFPTDSVQWSVRQTINSPFAQNTDQFRIKGDTILNGITYGKMYTTPDVNYYSSNETLNCFIRKDSTKKVFVKYPQGTGVDTTEYLLYDFGCNIGDTISIKLQHYTTQSIYLFEVTYIDSTTLGTGITRRIFLNPASPLIWACTAFGLEWIEGIGSSLGVLYNEIPQWGCDNGGYENACFWLHGDYIFGGMDCDINTDVYEVDNIAVALYPNPLSCNSVLKFPINLNLLEIFNVHGQKVLSENINHFSSFHLNKNDFLPGHYICILTSIDGKILRYKFINQ
ncbi:MAG TPA: T9SS type A sorting domain-containing protein [Bacteroidia bacterium]|jgi:hypothetical protein